MKLQVGVKILFKNKAGKYLLIKRSPKKYPKIKDCWDAVGGRIKAGQRLEENLKREIKEEISLAIKFNAPPKLLAAQDILRSPKAHVVRLTYLMDFDINDRIKLSDEAVAYKWFSYSELKKLKGLDRYVKELINKI